MIYNTSNSRISLINRNWSNFIRSRMSWGWCNFVRGNIVNYLKHFLRQIPCLIKVLSVYVEIQQIKLVTIIIEISYLQENDYDQSSYQHIAETPQPHALTNDAVMQPANQLASTFFRNSSTLLSANPFKLVCITYSLFLPIYFFIAVFPFPCFPVQCILLIVVDCIHSSFLRYHFSA